MKTSDLNFHYPENLVATQPGPSLRVMFCEARAFPVELNRQGLLNQVSSNDVVIINNTKVVKKRIFTKNGLEVLFLDSLRDNAWLVLMPSKKLKIGDSIDLPGGVQATLLEKGLPQKLQLNQVLDFSYFEKYGHMALPPYIQKSRGERASRSEDEAWYQTRWAEREGSSAAPTASLHFSNEDWSTLKGRGVTVCPLTLHVGLGTFLPVHAETLTDHKMHSEFVEIPGETLAAIEKTKSSGGRVWALGTTVTRALESLSGDWFEKLPEGGLRGETDIFIYPGFEFQVVDVLMTNFHQPQSTLLALVSAFAGLETTLHNYRWAIDKDFRLFSYGDLSVWTRP